MTMTWVLHRARGVVPPYDRDPADHTFIYFLALGVSTPRGLECCFPAWATDLWHRLRGGVGRCVFVLSVWPDAVSVPILAQAARVFIS